MSVYHQLQEAFKLGERSPSLDPLPHAEGGCVFCDPLARDIKIVKPLEDVEVCEKESASFLCEISHDEVETQWFSNDHKIRSGENVKLRQDGKSRQGEEGEPLGMWVARGQRVKKEVERRPRGWLGRCSYVLLLHIGKSYALVYKSVEVQDSAEIKFVAEKAESRAQLKVKGKEMYLLHVVIPYNSEQEEDLLDPSV